MSRQTWSGEEDAALRAAVARHGAHGWHRIAREVGGGRKACQCNARWNNYVKPGIDLSPFTADEDRALALGVERHGTAWRRIALALPARTAHAVKNRWQTILSRTLATHKGAPAAAAIDGAAPRGVAAAFAAGLAPLRCGAAAPAGITARGSSFALGLRPLAPCAPVRPAGVAALAVDSPQSGVSRHAAKGDWPALPATYDGLNRPHMADALFPVPPRTWPAPAGLGGVSGGAHGPTGGLASPALSPWLLPTAAVPCAPLAPNGLPTMTTPSTSWCDGGALLFANAHLLAPAKTTPRAEPPPPPPPPLDAALGCGAAPRCDAETLDLLSAVELIDLIDIVSMLY